MRFLVDNRTGGVLADWLKERGHDVLYSPELGPDPGDDELLAIAAVQGRVVITLDKGFARSVFMEGANPPGLIFLPDVTPVERCYLVEGILSVHSFDIKQGAWVILRNGKVRIRRPNPGEASDEKRRDEG